MNSPPWSPTLLRPVSPICCPRLASIHEDWSKRWQDPCIIVLSTSKAEEDIAGTYQLHANCFITKPLDLDEFFDVVRAIEDFWLTTARLPAG